MGFFAHYFVPMAMPLMGNGAGWNVRIHHYSDAGLSSANAQICGIDRVIMRI